MGTSGLWTRQSNVLSAISSEAFKLRSHFPVPKFITQYLSVDNESLLLLQAAAQLAGRQKFNSFLSLQQK